MADGKQSTEFSGGRAGKGAQPEMEDAEGWVGGGGGELFSAAVVGRDGAVGQRRGVVGSNDTLAQEKPRTRG